MPDEETEDWRRDLSFYDAAAGLPDDIQAKAASAADLTISPLAVASDRDLADELISRHRTVVILAADDSPEDETTDRFIVWHGGRSFAREGLVRQYLRDEGKAETHDVEERE